MNNSKLQKQADKWGKVHSTLHIRYPQAEKSHCTNSTFIFFNRKSQRKKNKRAIFCQRSKQLKT